jgi:hypothetical protein
MRRNLVTRGRTKLVKSPSKQMCELQFKVWGIGVDLLKLKITPTLHPRSVFVARNGFPGNGYDIHSENAVPRDRNSPPSSPQGIHFMKRLACFLLEGLVEQGPHRVWVTLGTFESSHTAQMAKRRHHSASVIDTRIIALYRDSGVTAGSSHRAHISTGTNTATEGSTAFTVA